MTTKALDAGSSVIGTAAYVRVAGSIAALGASTLAITRFGVQAETVVAVFFICVLVAVSAVDVERRIIPNRIVLPATVLVLGAHVVLAPERAPEWLGAAVGAAFILLLPILVYPPAMGFGDVKLALLLGAGLGREVVPALVIGFTAAAIVGIAVIAHRGLAARKTAIPFGPFLSAGAIAVLLLADGVHGV